MVILDATYLVQATITTSIMTSGSYIPIGGVKEMREEGRKRGCVAGGRG